MRTDPVRAPRIQRVPLAVCPPVRTAQLCINFANEQLQQFFNIHVIRSEQEEYQVPSAPPAHRPMRVDMHPCHAPARAARERQVGGDSGAGYADCRERPC